MIIRRHSEHKIMIGCADTDLLEEMKSYMDGKKVYGLNQIIIPNKASPKILLFQDRFGGLQNIEFGKGVKDIIRVVGKNSITRRENIKKIKHQYKTDPDSMRFDYKYVGAYEKPMAHQIMIFNLMRYNSACGIIADPGTAKTGPYLWCIDSLIQAGKVKKALIITLSDLKDNVVNEMKIQVPHLRPIILKKATQADNLFNKKYKLKKFNIDYDVYIISYGQMRSVAKYIKEGYFDIAIADEGHSIGSPDSEQTKSIVKSLESVKRKYIVTGTLNANNLMSFYMPWRFMGADTVPICRYDMFRANHMRTVDPMGRIWKELPGSRNKVARIQGDLSIRLLKEECLKDLPRLMQTTVKCSMSTEQKKLYEEFKKDLVMKMTNMCGMCDKFNNGCDQECPDTITAKNALVLVGKLHQLASGFYINTVYDIDDKGKEVKKTNTIYLNNNPKEKLLTDILSSIPESRKIIIFAINKPAIQIIKRVVSNKYGADSFIVCDGAARKSGTILVEEFKNSSKIRFFISSAKGMTGLNIQFSSYMIHFQKSYSYLKYTQAIGRQHRQGQTSSVTSISLSTKDTVDEVIDNCMANKRNLDIDLSIYAKI